MIEDYRLYYLSDLDRAILYAIIGADRPLNVTEVVALVYEPPKSYTDRRTRRAITYRHLDSLTSRGLLRKIMVAKQCKRDSSVYEYVGGGQ